MAARRRRGTSVSGGKGNDVIVVTPPAAPARRSSGGTTRRKAPAKKRRRNYATGGGGSYKTRVTSMAVGGAAYGLLEKHFPNLPTIPAIGRSGTVALAIYMWQPKQQILRDMGLAAAVIAGYTFGSTGSISGGHGVHGLAAQM